MSSDVLHASERRRFVQRVPWVIAVAAAAGAVLWIGGLWFLTNVLGGGAPPDKRLQQEVHALFEEAEHDETVVLADATAFQWDAVGVFAPYYPADAIEEDMGVAVPRSVTNWTQYDSHCLLVFRAGDRVAGWTRVETKVAQCADELSGRVYSDGEARFQGNAFAASG